MKLFGLLLKIFLGVYAMLIILAFGVAWTTSFDKPKNAVSTTFPIHQPDGKLSAVINTSEKAKCDDTQKFCETERLRCQRFIDLQRDEMERVRAENDSLMVWNRMLILANQKLFREVCQHWEEKHQGEEDATEMMIVVVFFILLLIALSESLNDERNRK